MIASAPELSFMTEQDKIYMMNTLPAKLFPGLEDSVATNAKVKSR